MGFVPEINVFVFVFVYIYCIVEMLVLPSILDTTTEVQESDTTKKGQENSAEENRIGQEGERRKSYSAAVIDGIKRNTTLYVGDSIIRKTDTRLSKGEDVVV